MAGTSRKNKPFYCSFHGTLVCNFFSVCLSLVAINKVKVNCIHGNFPGEKRSKEVIFIFI